MSWDCAATTTALEPMSTWCQMRQWSETSIDLETVGGWVGNRPESWGHCNILTQSTGRSLTWEAFKLSASTFTTFTTLIRLHLLFQQSLKQSDFFAAPRPSPPSHSSSEEKRKPNFSQFLFSLLLSNFRREAEMDLKTGFDTSSCSEPQINAYRGPTQCGAMSDPSGPFATCHEQVVPEDFERWEWQSCDWNEKKKKDCTVSNSPSLFCAAVPACLTCALSKATKSCFAPVTMPTPQPVRRAASYWELGGSSWTVVRCQMRLSSNGSVGSVWSSKIEGLAVQILASTTGYILAHDIEP